jgi:hypothetical protein
MIKSFDYFFAICYKKRKLQQQQHKLTTRQKDRKRNPKKTAGVF